MTHIVIQEVEKKFKNKKVPVIRTGYTVRVHQKIKEGEKERIQIFEGLVIGFNSGHGASKMLTVRKLVEGIGVEKIFPMHSPVVAKIEIVKTSKVRRGKLYYMRDLAGKSARLRTDVGLAAKDEKYSKKRGELMEAMGHEVAAETKEEAPAEVAAEAPKAEGEGQTQMNV